MKILSLSKKRNLVGGSYRDFHKNCSPKHFKSTIKYFGAEVFDLSLLFRSAGWNTTVQQLRHYKPRSFDDFTAMSGVSLQAC